EYVEGNAFAVDAFGDVADRQSVVFGIQRAFGRIPSRAGLSAGLSARTGGETRVRRVCDLSDVQPVRRSGACEDRYLDAGQVHPVEGDEPDVPWPAAKQHRVRGVRVIIAEGDVDPEVVPDSQREFASGRPRPKQCDRQLLAALDQLSPGLRPA